MSVFDGRYSVTLGEKLYGAVWRTCVCVCVCVYVCVCMCVCVYVYICIMYHVCMNVCMYVCMYVCNLDNHYNGIHFVSMNNNNLLFQVNIV